MSLGEPLDTLAAAWAADPHPTRAAAIGDALRKRGDLGPARSLLNRATDRYPDSVPLWLSAARLAVAEADSTALRESLGKALALDPAHRVALELAGGYAPELLAEAAPEPELTVPGVEESVSQAETDEPVSTDPVPITESLAALYHRQGHLELAMAAYAELVRRDPANRTAAERHQAIGAELAATRPVPFDSRVSGGRATGEWLTSLATAGPARAPKPTEFDRFFEPESAPAEVPTAPAADFDAFQRWLQELER